LQHDAHIVWLDIGGVRFVDPVTGKVLWRKDMSLDVRGPFWPYNRYLSPRTGYPVCISGNRLYIASVAESEIRSVDLENGNIVWAHPIPKTVDPSVFQVVGSHLVYAMHNDTDEA